MTKDDYKDIEHLFDRSKPIPSQDPRDYDTFEDWYKHLRLFREDGSINHAVLLGEHVLKFLYMSTRDIPKSPVKKVTFINDNIEKGTNEEVVYFDKNADLIIPYEDRMRFEKLRYTVPQKPIEYRKYQPPYKIIFKEK